MCIVCGVFFSSLTLFAPVTEPPNSANSNSTNIPKVQYQQTQNKPLAKQAQIKLADMLARLPVSDETSVLREKLQSIQRQLNTIEDDARTQQIIETRLRTVYQRILEKPSYQQEFNMFMKLLEVKSDRQAIHSLSLNLADNNSNSSTLFVGQDKRWGWIQ